MSDETHTAELWRTSGGGGVTVHRESFRRADGSLPVMIPMESDPLPAGSYLVPLPATVDEAQAQGFTYRRKDREEPK